MEVASSFLLPKNIVPRQRELTFSPVFPNLIVFNMRLPVGGDIIAQNNEKEVTPYKEFVPSLENETQIGETVTVTLENDRPT